MHYTVGTAAKATGVSKPTITRAIKNGRISASGSAQEGYKIDPAELHRVFPALPSTSDETPLVLRHETSDETGALQVEIKVLRERLADKDGVIDDLRHRLDAESEERRKLTMLLTHRQEQPVPAPVGTADAPNWFQRMIRPFRG